MSDADRIGEIIADFYERQGVGETVAPKDVIASHPDLSDELRKRFALDQFHAKKRSSIDFADFVDGHDVWMFQTRGGRCFGQESLQV